MEHLKKNRFIVLKQEFSDGTNFVDAHPNELFTDTAIIRHELVHGILKGWGYNRYCIVF